MSAIVVYSDQRSDFQPGFVYRNPRYFRAPLGTPDKVIVVGRWPNIVAAYEGKGACVTVVRKGAPLRAPVHLPPPSAAHPFDHDGDGSPGGSLPASERGDEIEAVRVEYEKLTGRAPDKRWGVPRLQKELNRATA